MAVQFDDETLILEMTAAMKANLNGRITAINTEKADGITLNLVDENAFFYLTFGTTTPNYSPCVLFAVNSTPQETEGGATSYKVELLTQLIFSDTMVASAEDRIKYAARYRRAIKEVLEQKFRKYSGARVIPLTGNAFATKSGSLYFTVGVGVEVYYA